MDFKDHADEIVRTELTTELTRRNVVLEHDFKILIRNKYGFSDVTIAGALRRMHPGMGLYRRHLTNELKNFYSLNVSGYPVVYLSNE